MGNEIEKNASYYLEELYSQMIALYALKNRFCFVTMGEECINTLEEFPKENYDSASMIEQLKMLNYIAQQTICEFGGSFDRFGI